jgi:SAM-dependent methyltransferase
MPVGRDSLELLLAKNAANSEFRMRGGAMNKTTQASSHWYPGTVAGERPSAWWYWGRAVYVSRRDYWRITKKFLAVGIPLGVIGVLFHYSLAFWAAMALAEIGLVLLAYSLFGLYRMYGHPGVHYIQRLVDLGDVKGKVNVADLHIGTYRHAFLLSDVLPEATIQSVDCWNVEGESPEEAVQDVRDLELPPAGNPRIVTSKADHFSLPLADASCDAVCFGFGTHEIPTGGPREKLFSEASRILKPGGKVLLFEHGWDAHNYVIFGPVIHHVTKRQDWDRFLHERFDDVKYARSNQAVDLFAATRR